MASSLGVLRVTKRRRTEREWHLVRYGSWLHNVPCATDIRLWRHAVHCPQERDVLLHVPAACKHAVQQLIDRAAGYPIRRSFWL